MNRVTLFVILLVGIGFAGCERIEQPGEIPGMGNAGGELKATAYEFNEDIVFGNITGVNTYLKSTKSDDVIIEGVAQGAGDQVIVTLEITNTNEDEWRSVYLRAGTLFAVNLSGYQHGILLAPVVICLSAGETRIVTLYLFCVNLGMNNSDESATYEILGVTESEVMMELVNALKGKMVNYEDYMIYYGEGAGDFYEGVKDTLQQIVWHVTNGDGILDDDYKFINGLPAIPDGVYPDGIYDINFVLPANWCGGCHLETAWGGNTQGANPKPWWFYYDATQGGQQTIYAGQFPVTGAYVEYINGEIVIELGDYMSLIDDDEAVKIQGYNADYLPETRPTAGHFDHKGTSLTVEIEEHPFYAIHLDVAVCE